jgi:hypothetical protein
MMVMPVMTVPAVVVTPVMVVPVAMMPVMMVTVVPTHLHGLHLIDFALRDNRWFNVDHSRYKCVARNRGYGRSLCAHSEKDRARDQSGTEFQEIPKLHHLTPLS